MYAGNIGNGQGLEKIIPEIAKKMGDSFRFKIVGGGSTKSLLEDAVRNEKLTNVDLHPPVGRDELINYYKEADILFLHLNNIPAFKRVLPSKIFEYCVINKPILAGITGYSADFLRKNISNAYLFSPGDSDEAYSAINKITKIDSKSSSTSLNNNFLKTFAREKIMSQMADHIVDNVIKKL